MEPLLNYLFHPVFDFKILSLLINFFVLFFWMRFIFSQYVGQEQNDFHFIIESKQKISRRGMYTVSPEYQSYGNFSNLITFSHIRYQELLRGNLVIESTGISYTGISVFFEGAVRYALLTQPIVKPWLFDPSSW